MSKTTPALALAMLFGLATVATVFAQGWPTRPIHVVVPYAPGSATDIVPRAVFDQVSRQVGQPIIIDNRPGGGTTLGTSAVAKSSPDGYTILVHSNALVTTPAIQANVPYDPVQDFSGVTPLGVLPLVLVIAPEKKIRTLKELVAYAKANPGQLNYAAAGIGTPPHLTMERFRLVAGFTGQVVPFRGAPEGLTEVMAGRVDTYFAPITPALPLIRDGKLLALAVSSSKRSVALPDVPSTIEAGFPDSDSDFWIGAVVPKQTPRELVDRLHREIVRGLQDSAISEKLVNLGVEPMLMTPAAFDARIAKETRISVELAKAAGIAVQ